MKLDIDKLNEAVEKAFDRIFEEEEKKEVKNTEPTQWHDDYSNKEEDNVVQTRINPNTKKPEFKIPTNDKVYDTRDAAIAALRENKGNKKVITINENDICNMVREALGVMNSDGNLPMDMVKVALERSEIAIKELNKYIGMDDSRRYDLAVIMNQINGIKKNLMIVMKAAGRDIY